MLDTIVSAAAALRAGRITAADLVERSLAAIANDHERTNAFVTVDAEGAREAARHVDRERARQIDRGPLHGIPISLKDLIDAAGVVTTAGSRVLHDRVAPADATVVARLREAGAIVIGRTNLHEFALGTTGEDSAFGAVRHPLDATRIAGGSSGGSAAAVAAGMGLGSIGTDTGGSVRIPAAACGVVGLKPSFGEVPTDGVIPLSVSLDHVGPIARTVQDAAWLFAVLAGRPPALLAVRLLTGVRLGRLTGYFGRPLEAAVNDAVQTALDRLARQGATLDEVGIDGAGIAETYTRIVLPEGAHCHAPYLDVRADRYSPTVRARFLDGRRVLATEYLAARDRRAPLRRMIDEALHGRDALVLPTLPLVAPVAGTRTPDVGGELLDIRVAMLKHTQLFNLTGHPAISIPVPAAGLPVGLQIVGSLGRTEELLSIAAACEAGVAAA
jgi:aspartyl-tRNA(Asn)/glutamyl-tRNA(Gln) amidotransferase subunit A